MFSSLHPYLPPPALNLWRHFHDVLAQACLAMGLPADLARQLWVTRIAYRQFNLMLSRLEALLRPLLYALALALPPSRATPARKQRVGGMPAGAGMSFDDRYPESWRAPFKAFDAPSRALNAPAADEPPKRAPERLGPGFTPPGPSSTPLALRLEALVRVCRDPLAAARRLRRLLDLGRAPLAPVLRPRRRRPRAPAAPSALALRFFAAPPAPNSS